MQMARVSVSYQGLVDITCHLWHFLAVIFSLISNKQSSVCGLGIIGPNYHNSVRLSNREMKLT